MPSTFFAKGLWDAHTTIAKIYEKNPQTLSEVIRIVEKFNEAQQVTAMLTPFMVSMMSNDGRCFVCGQTGHFCCHGPNVQCYSCDEFSHFCTRLPLKDSFLRNTTSPRQVSFQAMIHPHPKGQITIHSL